MSFAYKKDQEFQKRRFRTYKKDEIAFTDIDMIDEQTGKDFLEEILKETANQATQLAYKKYRFISTLKSEHRDDAETIWENFFNCDKEFQFWNIVFEKHSLNADCGEDDPKEKYIHAALKRVEQLKSLRKLLKILGMNHTQESKTFTHDEFSGLLKGASDLESEVRKAFGIKSRRSQKEQFTASDFHDMLRSVWLLWSNSKVTANYLQKITIDRKRTNIYEYIFEPNYLWDKITNTREYPDEFVKKEKKVRAQLSLSDILKQKRKSIPIKIRNKVWENSFGDSKEGTCVCCKETIHVKKWHCAHIIAFKICGEDKTDNLLPACSSCNKSMGIENLWDFKRRCYPDI